VKQPPDSRASSAHGEPAKGPRARLSAHGPWLLLLAAAAAVVWEFDILRSGETLVALMNHDLFQEFFPRHHFQGAVLASGRLPLWDPHQIAGLPFLATLQGGVLYPPNLLYALLPTGTAMGVLGLLHVTLSGAFTYALARALGRGPGAATLAGLAFMLGGSTLFLVYHTNAINSAPWLPAVLFCATRLHTTGALRWSLWLALALALNCGCMSQPSRWRAGWRLGSPRRRSSRPSTSPQRADGPSAASIRTGSRPSGRCLPRSTSPT